MRIVIAYDIPDDGRRLRTANVLLGYAYRVQRSVFEGDFKPDEYAALKKEVEGIIDQNEDAVRYYVLCQSCADKIRVVGQGEKVEKQGFAIF